MRERVRARLSESMPEHHRAQRRLPQRVPFFNRTFVGTHRDVVEEGARGAVDAAAVAADDVDGTGGVDHGCVPMSGSPQRASRYEAPGDT